MSLQEELLQKVNDYKTPEVVASMMRSYPPLVVAGTTASGKSAILKRIETISDRRHVVTHTTRQPRPGEINGQNYWFVSEEEMLRLINEEAFIEVKAIFYGHAIYGPSVAAYQAVITQGYKPVMIIDVQGVEEISKSLHSLRAFFLLPPTFEEWMRRLERRGRMSTVERVKRLKTAKSELQKALNDKLFSLVVNHEVQQTADEILHGATDAPTQMKNRELANRLIHQIDQF